MPQTPPAPPRHIIVLSHPDPDSFNALIAETYVQVVLDCRQKPVLRDLYAMHFDPVLRQDERPGRGPFLPAPDVEDELDIIRGGDVFTMIYPIWFGTPPAMLKGYIDRVLGAGVTARAVQDRAAHELLTGKRLQSITTSAARGPWLSEQGQLLGLQTIFDDYLAHAFGMKVRDHLHFGSITDSLKPREVEEYLGRVRDTARQICAAVATDQHDREAILLRA